MRICVIGDSWAGGMDYNLNIFQKLFAPHGHSIVNIGGGGASNQGQLRKLEYDVLAKDHDFDLILWIYTETVRNYTEFVTLQYGDDSSAVKTMYHELTYQDLYQDFKCLANQDFKHAQRLFNKFHIPFFVVGGAGKVDSDVNNYSFASWVKKSWNQEISQLDEMPINCYTHHLIQMIKHGNYNKTQALQEMSRTDTLESLMRSDSRKYPDGAHPSIDYYPELVDQVILKIKEKNSL